MKKLMVIGLVLALLFSMSVTAFAAGGFVSSPSTNKAPTVVGFDPKNDDCTAQVVITPFGDRKNLPEELQERIEKAYQGILSAEDLGKLNEDLARLAANMKIDTNLLAVSDLFNAHAADCDAHDDHYDFDLTLKADTLKNFVGLLALNEKGEWELVQGAKVSDGHLIFTSKTLTTYAIVVDSGVSSPQTGADTVLLVLAAMMVLSAAAIVVVAKKARA